MSKTSWEERVPEIEGPPTLRVFLTTSIIRKNNKCVSFFTGEFQPEVNVHAV